jgi:hypothetical protein
MAVGDMACGLPVGSIAGWVIMPATPSEARITVAFLTAR